MNRLLVVMFVLLLSFIASAEGTPGKINPNFNIGVLDLQRVSSNLYWVKNTQANRTYLGNFAQVDSSEPNYLSIGPTMKQCVAVAQRLTDVGTTSTWSRGIIATNRFSVPQMTPIATFYDTAGNKTTTYSNFSEYSHVGILISHDSGGFYMLEQNWEGTGSNPVGRLSIRYYSGSGNFQNNANNYYVINKP